MGKAPCAGPGKEGRERWESVTSPARKDPTPRVISSCQGSHPSAGGKNNLRLGKMQDESLRRMKGGSRGRRKENEEHNLHQTPPVFHSAVGFKLPES